MVATYLFILLSEIVFPKGKTVGKNNTALLCWLVEINGLLMGKREVLV